MPVAVAAAVPTLAAVALLRIRLFASNFFHGYNLKCNIA
jgi:hypothetical protein